MKTKHSKITAIVATSFALAFGATQPLYAVDYDKGVYQALVSRATQKTWVRVMVTLDVDVPLLSPDKQSAATLQQLAKAENGLLAELGNNAMTVGEWRNGLGQLGIYVKPSAFPKLAASKNIRNFSHDSTDNMRLGVYNGDGRLDRIEAEIEKNGFADVEVTLNLTNLDFEIDTQGKTQHKPTLAQQTEKQEKLPSLLSALHVVSAPAVAAFNDATSTAAATKSSVGPTQVVRIGREGLILLREHADVRSLQLANDNYIKPFQLDPEALAEAKRNGYANVTVELRRPTVYLPQRGKLADSAWQSQSNTLRRTLVSIFAAQPTESVTLARDFSELGGASMRMTADALQRISVNPDPRLSSITLIKANITPALSVSVPEVNMTAYHNMGYTGSGQTVAILDTGVEKNHPFLKTSTGYTKITSEACFSTTANGSLTMCPSPDAWGDSPPGLLGSAIPGTYCRSSTSPHQCDHGTHVAGIAAGRDWTDPNDAQQRRLIGMAPDASILAVQIFSYATINGTLYTSRDDVVAATQKLAAAIPPGGGEYTVNLSIGDGPYTPSCPASLGGFPQAFEDAVSNLVALRVPVVAAAGNNGMPNALSWPACTPKVIKVGGTTYTPFTGELFWNTSNSATPFSNYLINETELLAPANNIMSSGLITNGTPTSLTFAGTSMAAPHVAGLYAVLKSAFPGITVANATAWIMGSASIWTDTGNGYEIKRIHLP